MLTLLVAALLAAEPAPWPAKGDTVYVSATLTSASSPTVIVPGTISKTSESTIQPCVPMKVTKAKPTKPYWEFQDPAGWYEHLKGPWMPRLHKDEESCRAAMSNGEPRVVRNGWIHTIIP